MNIDEYIKQHNDIRYCEAIIFEDGSIEDCRPSHQQKLISISKESYNELMNIIPIDADFNNWLICHNNVIALWYDFCIYNKMNNHQKESLQKLIDNNILKENYSCYYTNEKENVEIRNKFLENEISEQEFKNFYKQNFKKIIIKRGI